MSKPHAATRRLSRRELLALLGVGAAGAAVFGSARLVGASSPPVGPTVPVPTLPPGMLAPVGGSTVAELAASLDWDVARMFEFVAAEVDYHAYSGVLRGATGTLWARAGNSADQAMLLGALLDEAAVPWRFAVGSLDAEAADKLADRAVPTVDDARRRAAEVLLPSDVAGAWNGEGPWQRTAELDDLFDTARRRVADTVELLTEALTSAGAAPADVPSTPPADELDQHVWVQYADGPSWIDLDPSVTDGVMGTVYASSPETSTSLPDDRFHTVTLRVTGEVVTGGVPARVEFVSHTVRSADVPDTPIYVVHAPTSWLDITSGLTGDQQYVATVVLGDLAVEGATPIVLAAGEGIDDVLGDASSAVEGQTIAEWLEVDVAVPQGGVRTATRLIYDRIPEERRASGDLGLDDLPPIVTTHIDDEIGDVFMPFAAPQIVSITAHPLPASVFGGETSPVATQDDMVAKGAFAVGHVRDLVALDQLASTGVAAYADEPIVMSIQMAPNGSPAGEDQTVVLGVDLVHIHRRAATLRDTTTSVAAGIVAGAIDHAAERFVVDGVGPRLSSGYFSDASAGRVFELASDADIAIVALSPGSAVDIAGLGSAPRGLIEEALAAGRFVVVPEGTVELGGAQRIGWWEYDPATGAAVDRMDDGRGASAAEYGLLMRVAWGATCFTAGLGLVVMIAYGAQQSVELALGTSFVLAANAGACAVGL